MNKKIIIADDSLTIQKVINITLSNEPYDLIQSLNETELNNSLDQKPHLILLDFNLSDEKNGYELIQMISEKSPATKVLVMLGTFDNVDESLLEELGVVDRIIKPFESSKFIQKCRTILESVDIDINSDEINTDEDNESQNNMTEEIKSDADDSEEWVIQSPEIQDSPNEEILISDEKLSSSNPLEQELNGWGMSVPEIIDPGDSEKANEILPPKITGENNKLESNDLAITSQEGQIVPGGADLEYPSITLVRDGSDSAEEDIVDISGEPIHEPEDLNYVNSELISETEKEQDPQEFWSVDEEEDISNDSNFSEYKVSVDSEEVDGNVDYKSFDQQVKDEIITDEIITDEIITDEIITDDIITDDIVDQTETNLMVKQVMESLKPMVENMVKDLCQKEIERIAWEIIPDLAENLIKKEIKEISDSVHDIN